MLINSPSFSVLYSIEEAIKAYRKLSQRNISKLVPVITVDQALILIILNERPELTQSEVADLVFKDYASMNRILNLMISKNYIRKTTNKEDKRRAKISITKTGQAIIEKLTPAIQINRETALQHISQEEISTLFNILKRITHNCKS
ncbi:MAG: MarR family transcriptional regulator [Bacteroidota bacterium]